MLLTWSLRRQSLSIVLATESMASSAVAMNLTTFCFAFRNLIQKATKNKIYNLNLKGFISKCREQKRQRIFSVFFIYQIFFRIFMISSLVGVRGFVLVQLSSRAASAMALSLASYSAYVRLGTASCTETGIPSSICIARI